LQGAAEDPGAGRLHLVFEDVDLPHIAVHLVVGHRRARLALDAVE
jgi:hypothetical protein